MLKCKKCGSSKTVKNGFVRNQQRWHCKECSYNFIEGDKRTNHQILVKKALRVLLYSTMKGTYNHLAKIFDTSPSLIYRWIAEASKKFEVSKLSGELTEIEFDEMWHYLNKKKEKFGLSKHLSVAAVELSHGKSVVVIVPHSSGFTTK
jgi:transposase-like protein